MARFVVNIDVDDLARGVAFYTSAFDLRVGRRLGAGVVELLGAEAPIYLLANPGGTAPFPDAETTRTYDRHWSPVHLDFIVSDLDEAAARVEAAGATRERDLEDQAWGRIGHYADPFGHGFCLIAFKPGGYDLLG